MNLKFHSFDTDLRILSGGFMLNRSTPMISNRLAGWLLAWQPRDRPIQIEYSTSYYPDVIEPALDTHLTPFV